MTVPKNADMLKFVTLGRSYDKNELIFNSECLNITVCDGARESALHYHTFFEIEVLLKGSAKTITDNTELQLSGGDCVFCMPGSVQKINFFNDATVVTMRFREGIISQSFTEKLCSKSFILASLNQDQIKKFCFALDILALARGESDDVLCLAAGFVQFTAALIKLKSQNGGCEKPNANIKTLDPVIIRAIMHTKLHVEKAITLKSLAKHLGYTPNYLGTLFKKETGKKYTEFLRDERLNLACVLLESTQMPVYEIAKQTGFENSAYFCRIYKNKFGRSPGQSR